GYFLRSITADSLKREIGSNRENEFRRVVVGDTVLQPHDFVYEGGCNGKRVSKSLGYTSRQAIPCCYLALGGKEQLFSTRSAPWHYGSGTKCDRCEFVHARRRDAMSCDEGGGIVDGRKSRRAFHNERSSQYVVTRRLTLPQPRARRVDNRFREGTTATVLVLPLLWTMFERRRHSGNQVDSQSAHFPHRDRSPTSLHKGNRLFQALFSRSEQDTSSPQQRSSKEQLVLSNEPKLLRAMCCFEHSYSGIFQDKANRKACFIGTSVFEKVTLVLLLLTLLSMTKVEGWNATGLVSLTLIIVVIIKLFSIAIAYSDLVDMSGDWSYLIEFGFGVILIAIVVGIELLVIMRTLHTAVAVIPAVFGTFLSSVSLMDLHQNMSVNSWWWEKKLINGCMYHVFRQYTLLWCLRIEEKPRVITIFDSATHEQELDATMLNSQ
ncbi:hypothetical protein ALC62_08233, partial [Cyphomyrmex costatus]